MKQISPVYFDYAATTPLDPRVAAAMATHVNKGYLGNPSSIHTFGRAQRAALEESRRSIAQYLDAVEPNEIIFTGSGAEANNLAIRGIVEAAKSRKPHIITTAIEHKSILATLEDLVTQDRVEVTYLVPDSQGMITVEQVTREIKHNTVLISVMYVNNEIGSVLPVRDIGKYLEKLNEERTRAAFPKIYFHADCVQALPYLDCRVRHLHLDLMTISAHKIGGPSGIGALYIKKRTPLRAMILGGSQEFEKRAGTENILGIIGFARAVMLLSSERESRLEHVKELKKYLVAKLSSLTPSPYALRPEPGASHIIPLLFPGLDGASILINLDLSGIAVSSGSACTSGSVQGSHVLIACGYSESDARSGVRVSLSHLTTKGEIDRFVQALNEIIKRLSLNGTK